MKPANRRRLAVLVVPGSLVAGAALFGATLFGATLFGAASASAASGPTPGAPVPTASKAPVATTIRLSPASATDPAGGARTITARVTTASGAPVRGARVLFMVTGANIVAGQATTGADGTASFTYRGRVSGIDAITACQDVNANQACDSGEPATSALRIWAPGLPLVPVTG
jgi:hypothetical protein